GAALAVTEDDVSYYKLWEAERFEVKPKPKPRLSLRTWFRCMRCGQMSRAAAEWRAHVNKVHLRDGVAVPHLLSYESAQQFPTCMTCVPALGFSDDQKYQAHLEDVHGPNAPLPDVQRRQRRHL